MSVAPDRPLCPASVVSPHGDLFLCSLMPNHAGAHEAWFEHLVQPGGSPTWLWQRTPGEDRPRLVERLAATFGIVPPDQHAEAAVEEIATWLRTVAADYDLGEEYEQAYLALAERVETGRG